MLIKLFNKIYHFITSRKYFRILLFTILLFYPFIFYYWYYYIGISAIGYHTNLIIPIYLIVVFDILAKRVSRISKIASQGKYIFTVIFIIEAFLITLNILVNFKLTKHGQYISIYDTHYENQYHTSHPYEKISTSNREFSFKRTTNSIGLSDKEWIKDKNKNTIRIICIGDSFTEGDGVSFENSYPQILQNLLNKKYKNIEVLNAGKRGSDPFYNYKHLKDILIEYQPDIVLQSFTTNDFYFDFIVRGGNKRFADKNKITFRHQYWWEPIYASSFISQILIQTFGGFDRNLIKKNETPQLIKEMQGETIELFKEYQELSKKNHFKLIVFTLPFNNDFADFNIIKKLYNNDNLLFYNKFRSEFSKIGLPFYNLQPCYKDHFKSSNTDPSEYYWSRDGHHNDKGYHLMAECIEDIILDDIQSQSLKKDSTNSIQLN